LKNPEHFVSWIRDAHSMEQATIDNIGRLLQRMKEYPDFCERYRAHLDESRLQLGRLERALSLLDADASFVKDTVMRLAGVFQAIGTAIAPDEPVKHCLAAYSYENFEIASYVSLVAAAEAAGHSKIAELCNASLAEERAMAEWLEDFIPRITRSFLGDEAGGAATSQGQSDTAA
jgi:ferritin-like metal-binding protein YciE